MRTLLTTPRLQLSPFSLADTEELHELFSDPLTHTIGSGPFTSISQTQQWIRLCAMRCFQPDKPDELELDTGHAATCGGRKTSS